MNDKNLRNIIAISVLTLLTVGLRILYINTSLWYDEACSWVSAGASFPAGIIDNLLHTDLQHTPLYFFLLHFWMRIFGDGEIALKSLSLIFGIASVPLVYTAAKKLSDKFVALMCTFVVSVCPILVYFSTEVRMYPAVVFLVALSLNLLIDFETKNDTKSLVKLVAANVLIPYTLVGGILYNISVAFCYAIYLFKNRKESFMKYLKGLVCEAVLLIPYFILLGYYAKARGGFVIRHEGAMSFFHIVDLIRNFFGIILVNNVYWPSVEPYVLNFMFTVLVVVPCVYFCWGFFKGIKASGGFLKTLYAVVILNLILFLTVSYLEINIATVRYILYLAVPIIILSIIGLAKSVSNITLKCLIGLFTICSIYSCITYANFAKSVKTLAFKSVRAEADEIKLTNEDIVIMPFGSDAPYYFRDKNAPRVYNFDFHKEVRNPYNPKFYNENQLKFMDKKAKYGIIYDGVFDDNGFSEAHYAYFKSEVIDKLPAGRYALIALYGSDVDALIDLSDLKKSISSVADIKDNTINVMLAKYLWDIRLYLAQYCTFNGMETKGNYTYILYQKQ